MREVGLSFTFKLICFGLTFIFSLNTVNFRGFVVERRELIGDVCKYLALFTGILAYIVSKCNNKMRRTAY